MNQARSYSWKKGFRLWKHRPRKFMVVQIPLVFRFLELCLISYKSKLPSPAILELLSLPEPQKDRHNVFFLFRSFFRSLEAPLGQSPFQKSSSSSSSYRRGVYERTKFVDLFFLKNLSMHMPHSGRNFMAAELFKAQSGLVPITIKLGISPGSCGFLEDTNSQSGWEPPPDSP